MPLDLHIQRNELVAFAASFWKLAFCSCLAFLFPVVNGAHKAEGDCQSCTLQLIAYSFLKSDFLDLLFFLEKIESSGAQGWESSLSSNSYFCHGKQAASFTFRRHLRFLLGKTFRSLLFLNRKTDKSLFSCSEQGILLKLIGKSDIF